MIDIYIFNGNKFDIKKIDQYKENITNHVFVIGDINQYQCLFGIMNAIPNICNVNNIKTKIAFTITKGTLNKKYDNIVPTNMEKIAVTFDGSQCTKIGINENNKG